MIVVTVAGALAGTTELEQLPVPAIGSCSSVASSRWAEVGPPFERPRIVVWDVRPRPGDDPR